MRLPHRLQGQKVKSQGGAGAYCGGDLAAQLVKIGRYKTLRFAQVIDRSLLPRFYGSQCSSDTACVQTLTILA